MKRRTLPTIEQAQRNRLGVPGRTMISAAAVVLSLALWLKPVPAQEHAPAPSGEHAPTANAPAHSPDTPVSAPAERGSHEGATEPGPGGQHAPQTGGEHEVGAPAGGGEHGAPGAGATSGTEAGHGAEAGHGTEAGHDAKDAHGKGEHGEAHEEEAFSIHLPSLIYGPLKKFWYSGPATLNAAGALDADGNPIDPAQLQTLASGPIEYTYHDHHSHASPKPEYHIKPTLGTIGTAKSGGKREEIVLNGQAVTLLDPTVKFAREGMFPELLVISLLTALTIALVTLLLTRNLQRIPDRRQTMVEVIYEKLDAFAEGLIGPHYKRYVPLVGTVFIYILIMNLAGIIPGWASPTANINVTAGLAIVIVIYTQIEGIRVNGLKGYFMHFVGDPWWLGPLNVPIHIIGELAKILSLTIRLFGNIFGEDVVIVILLSLGVMFTKGIVPFQFPMLFFAIFTSFVQAMVFSILTCVYIALMTTHEDHGGHHGEAHGHDGHDHGHTHDHGHAHA